MSGSVAVRGLHDNPRQAIRWAFIGDEPPHYCRRHIHDRT
jgi:hypothetical protein